MRQRTRRQIELASTIRVASGHMPHRLTRRDFVWSHGVSIGRSEWHSGPGRGRGRPPCHGSARVIGNTAFVPNSGATMNDHGQVVFGATLSDGRGVLLVATPNSHVSG